MSTPIGIEAAIPYLTAREMAELQKIIRTREKKQVRPVLLRPPKARISVSGRRTSKRKAVSLA